MENNKLILAGSGYMGDAILKQIENHRHGLSIIELARTEKKRSGKIKSIKIDFDNIQENMDYIDNSKIIYMAPPDNNSKKDTRIEKFLHNIERYKIIRFIYVSTSGVYGNCHGEVVVEKKMVNPSTDRAKRRVDAEQQITKFCEERGIDLVILRVPGIYGKDRLPMKRIDASEPLIIEEQSRVTNLIHVEDLSRIAIRALNINIDGTEIVNVSDGTAIKTTLYYEIIYKVLKKKLPNYITFDDALKCYDPNRISFLKESRILNTEKMDRLFPDCIEYRHIEEGIKASL